MRRVLHSLEMGSCDEGQIDNQKQIVIKMAVGHVGGMELHACCCCNQESLQKNCIHLWQLICSREQYRSQGASQCAL